MKLLGASLIFAAISFGDIVLIASNPVDFTQRNDQFAPVQTIAPEISVPKKNDRLQNRRVDYLVKDKKLNDVGDQRAAINVSENQAKTVRHVEVYPPQLDGVMPMRALNQRASASDPKTNLAAPTHVAKYQNGLTHATTLCPSPTFQKRTTFGRLNRFIINQNPSDQMDIPVVSVSGVKVSQP